MAWDAHETLGTFDCMKDIVFYLGTAALFAHELDAIANHEWRGLPILRSLPDDTGMALFVAAHVPLFAILIALVSSANTRTRRNSRLVIGGFLLVHGVLHALSMRQPTYEFTSMLSNLLIFGGSACGALYLALEARHRPARAR
jgi:Family of unknown function (DUF6713)